MNSFALKSVLFLYVLVFLTSVSGQSLSGTYSVGTISSDYLTLNSAVSALVSNGVSGPVVFDIEAGVYQEQISIPSITGTSSINTITFQSLALDTSSVKIEFTASNSVFNYVIKLDDAEYIRLKYLTIRPKGNTYRVGVLLSGGTNNTISNNYIYNTIAGGVNNDRTPLVYLQAIPQGQPTNHSFENNTFLNGGSQIKFNGTSQNTTIKFNQFLGTTRGIIDVVSSIGLNISDNTFSNYIVGYIAAININSSHGNIVIERNKIELLQGDGIRIQSTNTSILNPIVLRNNFVSSEVCLRIELSPFINIFNNSFNASGFTNLNFQSNPNIVENVKAFNNIFRTEGSGMLFNSFAQVNPIEIDFDHNVYFNSDGGSNFGIGSGNVVSLATWQDTFNIDSNSFITNPLFTTDTDLHINNAIMLSGAGIPITGLTHDIDGDIRNVTTPDIGADEFVIDTNTFIDIELVGLKLPVGNSCINIDSIVLELTNHSIFPIDSIDVFWSLFSTQRDSLTVFQTIQPDSTIEVNLGAFAFNSNTIYELKFGITKPNGLVDHFPNNDFKTVTYSHIADFNIYERLNATCGTDKELFIKTFPRNSILWSTGSTLSHIGPVTPGNYSVTVTDDTGCLVTKNYTVN
ncbi:MAG: hypothetical protein AB8B74_02190 [Crocinitomicaceae bacterium]